MNQHFHRPRKRQPIIDKKTGRFLGEKKHLLTKEQLKLVKAQLKEGLRLTDIAQNAGVTINVLRQRFNDQLKRVKRPGQGKNGGQKRDSTDPSPDEIWNKLTKQIQAGWSDEQRWQAAHGAFNMKKLQLTGKNKDN